MGTLPNGIEMAGGSMLNIAVIFSKIDLTGTVFFIHSNTQFLIDDFSDLHNEPDQMFFLNPKKEWRELLIDKIDFIYTLPEVNDNTANVLKDYLAIKREGQNDIQVFCAKIERHKNEKHYYNPIIHSKKTYSIDELVNSNYYIPTNRQGFTSTDAVYDLRTLSFESFSHLSKSNHWAFSKEEMSAIINFYKNEDRLATRIEIELLAQTWSEHCKHKIFNAEIKYTDLIDETKNKSINSLYKTYIKGSTKKINHPACVSVFDDNAGVVDFNTTVYFAIKVETHNSPSALDPYGGALTGILGVNRDILGTGKGFAPLFNTNVFCVGDWNSKRFIPKELKHPKEILKGVHKGIEDGGNKSGIPTVAGAMLFDPSYTGKPLVFCGTVGIHPIVDRKSNALKKEQAVGDLIIMAGGRVGRDGIHGATMSSVTLDQETPSQMVQIGDPFTQKKLTDFILNLRDLNFIKSITDNGAGGLSSSVGEMAQVTNGAIIDLDQVKLKYRGLSNWEILVSESQERMTIAISPDDLDSVLNISKKFSVDISVIGKFTDSGYFEARSGHQTIMKMPLTFLFDGAPKLKLNAIWNGPVKLPHYDLIEDRKLELSTLEEMLNCIISDSNIVSKKKFIRNYDHEVKGMTYVKPLGGLNQDSPNDGSVLKLGRITGNQNEGVAVSIGIAPFFSSFDTRLMSFMAFDEAIRTLVLLGVDLDKIALTDNFCWPDPLSDQTGHKLAQLVRACEALYELTTFFKTPLVSGKDSMKNDFKNDEVTISSIPTLLITGLGYISDIKRTKRSGISRAGELVYKISYKKESSYFGHFLAKYYKVISNDHFKWDLLKLKTFYQLVSSNISLFESMHDVSDGGAIVALSESLFLRKLGIQMSTALTIEELFSEYPGQYVVSIKKEDQVEFEDIFKDYADFLGETISEFKMIKGHTTIDLNTVYNNWSFSWE